MDWEIDSKFFEDKKDGQIFGLSEKLNYIVSGLSYLMQDYRYAMRSPGLSKKEKDILSTVVCDINFLLKRFEH